MKVTLYATESVYGNYVPQVGDDIQGIMWVTGNIIEYLNYMKAQTREARGENRDMNNSVTDYIMHKNHYDKMCVVFAQ